MERQTNQNSNRNTLNVGSVIKRALLTKSIEKHAAIRSTRPMESMNTLSKITRRLFYLLFSLVFALFANVVAHFLFVREATRKSSTLGGQRQTRAKNRRAKSDQFSFERLAECWVLVSENDFFRSEVIVTVFRFVFKTNMKW